jgi:phage tail-like protein
LATTLPRAYVSSKFALDLDGEGTMGWFRSADGGGLTTDVQTYQPGHNLHLWRQVGKPKLADISLTVGMGMSQAFYAWISDFFKRKVTRKSGSIIAADFNYTERARRSFTDALISEVQIPTLDGGSKDAALMTVKIVPEGMEYKTTADGARLDNSPEDNNKLWHAANFRFTIDGLADSFKRVTKIDQFSIKQEILKYPSGHRRTEIRVPGRLEFPNITVYVPEVDAQPIVDQGYSRLIDYKKPGAGGMTGAIEFISPKKDTLCTINLKGVDIVSAEPQKLDATGETIALTKLQIQVEKMEFVYGSGGGGGA